MDWNEVTAIATAGLALLTLALVGVAYIAARYARRDIEVQLNASHDDLRATREATQTAQATAQRQLEASYRPLLIDVVPTGPVSRNDPVLTAARHLMHLEFPGGHRDTIDPRKVYVGLSGGRINIAVPLRNVGNGLAVILPALITVGGERIGEMVECAVQSKLVPPGETTRVVCAPRLTQLEMADYPWVVILHVPYQDFIGGQPTIARVWLEQRYKETEWILHGIDQLIGDDAREQMGDALARRVNPSAPASIPSLPTAAFVLHTLLVWWLLVFQPVTPHRRARASKQH